MDSNSTSLDLRFSLAYEELRRMARGIIRSDGVRDISATTLVNEAWLKLSPTAELSPVDHLHFRRIVAQAMRFILVDASRRRSSKMRGGNEVAVTFDEALYYGCSFRLGPELLGTECCPGHACDFIPAPSRTNRSTVFWWDDGRGNGSRLRRLGVHGRSGIKDGKGLAGARTSPRPKRYLRMRERSRLWT